MFFFLVGSVYVWSLNLDGFWIVWAGKEMNVLRADGSLMSVKCGLTRRRHGRENIVVSFEL